MATVLDLVRQALQDLMVTPADGTVESVDAANGLEALNNLVDELKTNSLMVYAEVRTTFVITPSTGTYLVGTSQVINVPRPQFVDGVGYVDSTQSPPLEIPLAPFTDAQYQVLAFKTSTSIYPTNFYYNRLDPTTGTIKLWPVPTSASISGTLYARTQVEEFTSLSTTVSLPPGWRRMFIKNLAMDLAPRYEQEPTQTLVDQARRSMGALKLSNLRPVIANLDPGAVIGGNNGRYFSYAQFQSGQF